MHPTHTRHLELISAACRTLENSTETPPPLAALAADAGMSAFHFHRIFKNVTGVTPKAYAAAQRASRVRCELEREESVTRAMYNAGFNSSGRFYENAAQALGMKPSAYRAGGAGETVRYACARCALGTILVAQTGRGVCAVSLGDDATALVSALRRRFFSAALVRDDARLRRSLAAVIRCIDEPARAFGLPLDIRGTAFQVRVWEALRAVPAGSTVTYSELARRLGEPNAVRAVARACASNTLAVAIPCHRAVRADGGLAGYRWGLERKRRLLDGEQAAAGRKRK